MEWHLLIRFNGCLNGKRKTTVNLLLIKFKVIGYMSVFELKELLAGWR
jgi:hypothetical protein